MLELGGFLGGFLVLADLCAVFFSISAPETCKFYSGVLNICQCAAGRLLPITLSTHQSCRLKSSAIVLGPKFPLPKSLWRKHISICLGMVRLCIGGGG